MVLEYAIRNGIVMVFTYSGKIVLSLIMLIFFGAAIVAGAIGLFGGVLLIEACRDSVTGSNVRFSGLN
jgi:hypothetical protein